MFFLNQDADRLYNSRYIYMIDVKEEGGRHIVTAHYMDGKQSDLAGFESQEEALSLLRSLEESLK